MGKRLAAWSGLGLAALLAIAGGGWLLSLPPAPSVAAAPPVPPEETDATLAALRPPKRERPLVAIVGINDATETTDYLMPYGILRRADVADVVALSTGPGPVKLFSALSVMPDATVAAFDGAHPDGADYVIVPAMSRDDDPVVLDWVRRQAAKGAIVVGVCAGAKVVAAAGLLDGRRATTHWYYRDGMLERHPSVRYVADRRIVVDGRVATTTGITASMPMMLTLVEAIAGRDKARKLAGDIGVDRWNATHASAAFRLNRTFALTVIGNAAAFWNREELGIALIPGMDEVSLALAADAWSRTYRSRAVAVAATADAVTTRNGVRVIPERIAADGPAARRLTVGDGPPADILDRTLHDIALRFGAGTADVVAMQLEYLPPRDGPGR